MNAVSPCLVYVQVTLLSAREQLDGRAAPAGPASTSAHTADNSAAANSSISERERREHIN
ncbi:MAG: hypothetical protein JOY58_01665 [Solirubrobacterales bacterium]|nr:hypothetical protein [Solirubrobacterales bacterium]MBV9046945.1 hypothetical protein [Solirubrobacterales bacterium]